MSAAGLDILHRTDVAPHEKLENPSKSIIWLGDTPLTPLVKRADLSLLIITYDESTVIGLKLIS